jgi:hypothetical protein
VAVRAHTSDTVEVMSRPSGPRELAARGKPQIDIKASAGAPTVGVHWGVIAIALAAAIWFVLAMVVLYASGVAGADYLLWIVAGVALIFFALTLGLARWAADDPRWTRSERPSLSDFVEDNVAIATGVIAAREAMIQLLTLPIVLAVGATAIAIVFLAVS